MPIDQAQSLEAIIRKARTERAWPQEQLADAAGVSLRTVQRVERGLPCSKETIQSLAAVLELNAADLIAVAPYCGTETRVLGLASRHAFWIGVALCLPSLAFIAMNVGYEELGWSWLAPVMPHGWLRAMWGSPLIVLGGPFAALILNVPHMLSIRLRPAAAAVIVDGLVLRWQTGPMLVVAVAFAMLGVLALYLLGENLGHMIRAG